MKKKKKEQLIEDEFLSKIKIKDFYFARTIENN